MDKFKELEERIKEAIKHLDEQINTKQNEIKRNNDKIDTTDESIKSLENSLKAIDEKREIVEAIENKNILLYVIREWLSELLKEYQGYIKSKQWFAIISIPILASIVIFLIGVAIIGGGIPSILVLSALISLYFVGAKLDSIIKLHYLKKNYTFFKLSGVRDDIIKAIDEYRRDIANLKARNSELYTEIQTLQAEKGNLILDLERVRSTREQVINEKAPEILNAAFKEFDDSDIKERIRIKEKKEGEE